MEVFKSPDDVNLDEWKEYHRVRAAADSPDGVENLLAKQAEDNGAEAYAIVGYTGKDRIAGEAILYRKDRSKKYEHATKDDAASAIALRREEIAGMSDINRGEALVDKDTAQTIHPEGQNLDPAAKSDVAKVNSPASTGADPTAGNTSGTANKPDPAAQNADVNKAPAQPAKTGAAPETTLESEQAKKE
ncbi:hypothetical protein pEaSNUABM11_00195 [Erwinia phage pEa_SNUABM_11]|nr:hypothetical protein pEaSNUABM11_00195 [Erwinia phage pEa_SNUABM_11]